MGIWMDKTSTFLLCGARAAQILGPKIWPREPHSPIFGQKIFCMRGLMNGTMVKAVHKMCVHLFIRIILVGRPC